MPSVLITGAGRGIGRAAALRMAEVGWDVFAGVRNEAAGKALATESPQRITPVALDVTAADDVAGLADVLPVRLDALVNNAGIAVGGALESLPIDELRHQLDVNVIAQVAVTQAVLPRLREATGRIVFISSISGLLTSPMLGAYSASKYAIEAIGDALRMELRPWRMPVVLIEPGQIATDLWHTAPQVLEESVAALSPEHRRLYAGHIDGLRKTIPRAQKMAVPVDRVSKVVEKALTARRPKARYLVGAGARPIGVLAHLAPSAVVDPMMATMSGVPRKV